MAGTMAPQRRPLQGDDSGLVRKRKLAHQSRTSLTPEEQEQAQRDAEDPNNWALSKMDRKHIAAHKENIRRDKAAKAAADKQAAADAQARSFGGRAKRVQSVAGTVGQVTSGGGLKMDDASGFVLGLLAWSWIVLPFIQTDASTGKMAGASGVKDMLRAKFFNKDANGNPLP